MTETKAYPRFQTSYMVGPLQVVVREDDAQAFQEALEYVASLVPVIDAVGEKINPPKTIPEPAASQMENEVANQLGGQVVGKTCQHGAMTLKSGATWEAWMCNARQGDPSKCQPIDAKTGRPWPKKG